MSALHDLRVLVVENDEMSATLLQMQLAHAGAVVVGVAASVSTALALLDQAEPQIALLDYRLADNETSDPVAEALGARGIPFVLATGMSADHLPAVFRTGVLLGKPYLTTELTAALTRALQANSVTPTP